MPARTDIQSICVLGSGPIVIGQAAEFDYSGVQAVKALKADGYRVVLVNSNPATIMTDPDLADATYIEPLHPDVVAKILEHERPDAILPTVGGQTALNLALALDASGVLESLGIELIGASADVIDKAENRQRFKQAMESIGLSCAASVIVHSIDEASEFRETHGLPLVIRPSFTLGGTGGGIAFTEEDFVRIVKSGIEMSPTNEVLVEECLLGWKEYELEIVRDKNDNVIVVCAIENLDPMGVHTGDSITVAPTQTLSDREYQRLRNAGIAIMREIGVETGGSNVQFAIDPKTGRMLVIEMNPRVSRSSALASKATGFPIAKVAAKLAVGYTLDEIENDITKKTKAAFEPSLDYVVVKMPRFAFEKFKGADRKLTTQMKSVGEVMAIGRTFAESLGKAMRSLEYSFDTDGIDVPDDITELTDLCAFPSPERIWFMFEALRRGASVNTLVGKTGIDPWFLNQMVYIVKAEERIRYLCRNDTCGILNADDLWEAKQMGLSDKSIANLIGVDSSAVREHRRVLNVLPVMKRVDTCAGEFEAHTPYLYSTYERPFARWTGTDLVEVAESEARPTTRDKVIILGGGPIRIGQGIEFDYCCVHAAMALEAAGIESIMINCNPETVSTDYDTASRLYFEPVTLEDVLNVVDIENPMGVIVQFGGQTPLKLAASLEQAGVKILGTLPESIDRAEDRERSTALVEKLGLKQPLGGMATSIEEAIALAERIAYPVMIRPSYVLGGRAMETVYNTDELRSYLKTAVRASENKPVLVDRFLEGAIEVDVDLVCDGKRVVIGGIMQHIEAAGIHSGDSACVLPPHTLAASVVGEIADAARALALELGVVGLMNAQFAVRKNRVFVIEVNPRASRTVPFVSKATGLPLAAIATRVMLGTSLDTLGIKEPPLMLQEGCPVSVKEAVLPFIKFPGVDPILGPEMRSTGEVMGIGDSFTIAFAKSQLAAGITLPLGGALFVSVSDADKEFVEPAVRRLVDIGFKIVATSGTCNYLKGAGISAEQVNKVGEGSPHALDLLRTGEVSLVINTTVGAQAVRDSASLRRASLEKGIPYYTTVAAADAASLAITYLVDNPPITVKSIQKHLSKRIYNE